MSTPNRHAYLGGEIIPIENAKVSIMTSSFNYGTAIFEGIRAYWNPEAEELFVFRLREHYERFLRNCRFLMIELPQSVDSLCEATLRLLRAEGFRTDTYIRPVGFKSGTAIGVRLHDLPSDCSIFAVPFGAYIDRPSGARLTISAWRRLDDNALPARGKIVGAYVNSAMAKTEATLKGFDDALMLGGDGHVSEASAANFFIVRDRVLITPPTTADILEGITRATILHMARDLSIETCERPIDRSEVYFADEAFLCGTAVGLVPVIEIDHRPIGTGEIGAIAARLGDLYDSTARGRESRYLRWCTPVYSGETTPRA